MVIKEQEYLEHFGIPGMKWGHRKAQQISGVIGAAKKNKAQYESRQKMQEAQQRAAIKKKASSAVKKTSDWWKKGVEKDKAKEQALLDKRIEKGKQKEANKVKNLSNKELQTRIDRMRLEQNYKYLKKDSSALGRGQKYVEGLGKDVVKGVVVGTAVAIGKDLIMKKVKGE